MKRQVTSRQQARAGAFPSAGLLQRKCVCGNHTIAGGECQTCRKAPLNRESTDSGLRVLAKAPTPAPASGKGPVPPGPLAKPGISDLYISVISPAKISSADVLNTTPLLAPSSGISFQLSHHATFKQDEYGVGVLRWKPAGQDIPESKQEEEIKPFRHAWNSFTVDRPDLPGSPIMLKDSDTHLYGLAVRPGSECEEAGKKHPLAFDRKTSDWSFHENAMFVDTVTFKDKEIRRRYFFDYESKKAGANISASVYYSNVDKVETV